MENRGLEGMIRAGGCAALLLLLGVCGYIGRMETAQQASAPVSYEALDADWQAARTLAQADARLQKERTDALAVLDSVITDPRAGEDAVKRALQKKTELAGYMDSEARLERALARLGIVGAASVGEKSAVVFVPPLDGQDEKKRMQILDLASGLCGLGADSVKIILVKNE